MQRSAYIISSLWDIALIKTVIVDAESGKQSDGNEEKPP